MRKLIIELSAAFTFGLFPERKGRDEVRIPGTGEDMTGDDVGKAAGDRLRVGAGHLAGASRAGLNPGGGKVDGDGTGESPGVCAGEVPVLGKNVVPALG